MSARPMTGSSDDLSSTSDLSSGSDLDNDNDGDERRADGVTRRTNAGATPAKTKGIALHFNTEVKPARNHKQTNRPAVTPLHLPREANAVATVTRRSQNPRQLSYTPAAATNASTW